MWNFAHPKHGIEYYLETFGTDGVKSELSDIAEVVEQFP